MPASPQPIAIVPNVGQVAFTPSLGGKPNIQFVASQSNSTTFISPNELDVATSTTTSSGQQQESTQSMVLDNANADAIGFGQQTLASVSNFYVNGVSRTNVPNYGQVTFANVYQGIDLSYSGSTGRLEYAFTIDPGANATPLSSVSRPAASAWTVRAT